MKKDINENLNDLNYVINSGTQYVSVRLQQTHAREIRHNTLVDDKIANLQKRKCAIFLARDVIYHTSRAYATMSVSVRLSVCL